MLAIRHYKFNSFYLLLIHTNLERVVQGYSWIPEAMMEGSLLLKQRQKEIKVLESGEMKALGSLVETIQLFLVPAFH